MAANPLAVEVPKVGCYITWRVKSFVDNFQAQSAQDADRVLVRKKNAKHISYLSCSLLL
jgi:hypothetical protein